MATSTTSEKVSFGEVVNATVSYNNNSDTNRKYDISANFHVTGKHMDSVDSGEAKEKVNGMTVASFNSWSEESLSVTFNTAKDRTNVFSLIEGFIADVKTKIETAEN